MGGKKKEKEKEKYQGKIAQLTHEREREREREWPPINFLDRFMIRIKIRGLAGKIVRENKCILVERRCVLITSRGNSFVW